MPKSHDHSRTARRGRDSSSSSRGLVAPPDRAWRRCLPRITDVQRHEALTSLILRLEELNGLPAGALIPRLRTYFSFRLAPRMVTGHGIDFDLFCDDIAGADPSAIVAATLRETLYWQYGTAYARGPSLFHAIHTVCPACAEARVFLLSVVALPLMACPRHGLRLHTRCSCGVDLRLFRRQRPFTCHACGADYASLPRQAAAPSALRFSRSRERTFHRLVALTPQLEQVGPGGIAVRLAELAIRSGASADEARFLANRHAMPVAWVVAMLERLGARPSDLLRRAKPHMAETRRAIA